MPRQYERCVPEPPVYGAILITLPLNEMALVRIDRGMNSVAQVELREHPTHVRLHGRFREEEVCGDLGIRQPCANAYQNFTLPLRQIFESVVACASTHDR